MRAWAPLLRLWKANLGQGGCDSQADNLKLQEGGDHRSQRLCHQSTTAQAAPKVRPPWLGAHFWEAADHVIQETGFCSKSVFFYRYVGFGRSLATRIPREALEGGCGKGQVSKKTFQGADGWPRWNADKNHWLFGKSGFMTPRPEEEPAVPLLLSLGVACSSPLPSAGETERSEAFLFLVASTAPLLVLSHNRRSHLH